jgi:hypothetical protein
MLYVMCADKQVECAHWGVAMGYMLNTCLRKVYVHCLLKHCSAALCYDYRGADKSLARPTSRCIFFMVRIFRLMLVLLYI